MWVYIVVFTSFAVYITLSFIFLRKPHFLHKRRRPAFIARNIAHRGGAAESIENTLLAFDTGLTNGVEMLELDCHLTKDNQVVVHHDFSLDRTTGEEIFIRDIEYHNLPRISTNVDLYYDASTVISCDNNPTNEELLRIPLLKDVFERYPAIPINIDVKEHNDELIRQISKLIQEYQREHLTYWGSFNHVVCQKLTAENSRIVRFCSLKEAIGIVIAYWLGLLPFIPLKPGVFEVPIPGEVFQKITRNFNWKFKMVFYLAERALNNKSMFVHLQRRGIPVYVWTLNNEQEFEYAIQRMSVTVEELHIAVEANDNATTEQLLGNLCEGLRHAREDRERFLDEFDIVLQWAKESGKSVEQLIDNLLAQDGVH
ncbi:unnamed protein product [Rotaria sordida]|uniref:GP-PDE domain-containing protein n=1 Tax=Rotaria sordida TaxID=392033 RepID=A0A813YX59_9BILA|nr:unnamed protein product [Rotaria sordida]